MTSEEAWAKYEEARKELIFRIADQTGDAPAAVATLNRSVQAIAAARVAEALADSLALLREVTDELEEVVNQFLRDKDMRGWPQRMADSAEDVLKRVRALLAEKGDEQ